MDGGRPENPFGVVGVTKFAPKKFVMNSTLKKLVEV
jgi:hypothetical protein